VLGALVLLSVIAAAFVTETRTETKLARNAVENAKARALADAGVHRAILDLLDTPGGEDEEEEDEEDEEDRAPGPAAVAGWRVDGTVYRWTFAGEEVLISVQDETGKIDLNRAQDELLRGLFESVGVEAERATALVDAIADFRDEDDLTRPSGAEDDDYRAAGLAWGAKDAPFETVAELQRVLGMTRELYEQVAPVLTVYARRPGFNPLFALRGVLLAVPGIDEQLVDGYLVLRAEAGASRAEDPQLRVPDIPYRSVTRDERATDRTEDLNGDEDEVAVEGDEDAVRAALPGGLGIERYYTIGRSRRVYSVRAEARTGAGGVFVRQAIVRLDYDPQHPFEIHVWKRGRLETLNAEATE
jgi:general secretion pathway protein K